MRQGPHHHYDQLADRERDFVDAVFDGKTLYELAKEFSVPLAGDDRVERAVDALARAVIESRPKAEHSDAAAERDREDNREDDIVIDGIMETHLALKMAGLL